MAGVPRQHTPPGPGIGASLAGFWSDIGPVLLRDMQTLPQRAGSALMQPVEALDRFGRTLMGQEGGYGMELDPSGRVVPSQQLFDDANLLGGMAMTGSVPIPKAPNSLGMFGGVMARTADKAALKKAQSMAEKGASREDIWNETGWFKGVDGKWRFEIDDSKATLTERAGAEFVPGDVIQGEAFNASAPDFMTHSALSDAYPFYNTMGVKSQWARGGSYAEHPSSLASGGKARIVRVDKLGTDARSTGLHEFQHAVQNHEGFATGGNRDTAFGSTDPAVRAALAEELDRLMQPMPYEQFASSVAFKGVPEAEVRRQYASMLKSLKAANRNVYDPISKAAQETAGSNVYKRLAGEVEARNVQTRKDMTPAERRAKAPWLTQDVPDPLQIVRFHAGAVARPTKLSA